MIKGTTRLLGVIGYPVEHSFSPLMHNAAISHLQATSPQEKDEAGFDASLDTVYLPFPIAPSLLKTALDGFSAIGLRGFNVTIPHKQTIMPLLDEISDVAQAIGAVNTVWRSDIATGESGHQVRWHGTNTDAAGFLAPIKALTLDWQDVPALILGNGGAARAVVAACVELGCAEVWVCGRSPQKRQAFAQSWRAAPNIAAKLSVFPWQELPVRLPQAGLVVNATPVGMHPNIGASPLSDTDMNSLGRNLPHSTPKIAYDLIYTPRPTVFLQQASAAGFVAIDGLEMLVQQGAAALEIWLGQPAPVDVMRRSLLAYLGQAS
ncbi:MAG: shikimate dehydrogenase [Cyanobacteria bacterium P01_D01_bin.105]